MKTLIPLQKLFGGAMLMVFTTMSHSAEVTIDGTSGSNSISTGYATDGNLTINLGFFAEYLIVGGGGGGGAGIDATSTRGGGGGGAGGLLTNEGGVLSQVSASSHSVIVGNGGVGASVAGNRGSNGGNSSIFGFTAIGGGGGAGHNQAAGNGGSGGGASSGAARGNGTAGQGNIGGTGGSGAGWGGGGGGAGQVGGNAIVGTVGGNGGDGLQNAITGTNLFYAGGGAGRRSAFGGSGGGGNSGLAGTDGLGGGGGGNTSSGAAGGSGVVIVRYDGTQAGTGGTITSVSGDTVHQFTANGALDLTGLDLNARLGVTLTGDITGSGDLIYNGPGKLTLSGTNNTYSGATNVNAGTLIVNSNISTSALTTVAVGATLGGSGTVGAALINGTLAVGSSPGQMNFTDTLVLTGSTIIEIDGNSGAGVTGGHDFINLTGIGSAGIITYGGTMTLDMGVIFGTGSYNFNLFDMANEAGTFTGITLTDQYFGSLLDGDMNGVWDLTSGNNTWVFTESTGVLNLTVIPEPRVVLIGGLGLLTLLRRRRY